MEGVYARISGSRRRMKREISEAQAEA